MLSSEHLANIRKEHASKSVHECPCVLELLDHIDAQQAELLEKARMIARLDFERIALVKTVEAMEKTIHFDNGSTAAAHEPPSPRGKLPTYDGGGAA